MNRKESQRALEALAASPAAGWIGNRLIDNGSRLLQKCMRCGTEEVLELPRAAAAAFQGGARGDALASQVEANFDEKLYAWKRKFQIAHEGCPEKDAAA